MIFAENKQIIDRDGDLFFMVARGLTTVGGNHGDMVMRLGCSGMRFFQGHLTGQWIDIDLPRIIAQTGFERVGEDVRGFRFIFAPLSICRNRLRSLLQRWVIAPLKAREIGLSINSRTLRLPVRISAVAIIPGRSRAALRRGLFCCAGIVTRPR